MNLILDVSNNNPIDEQTLRRSGAIALIAKATEGTTFRDPTYETHRKVAQAAGVPFGAYLFLHPGSEGSEANYFLDYAFPMAGDIQPIVDCEVTDGQPMNVVAQRCVACVQKLRSAGFKPIVYSDVSFLQQLIRLEPALKHIWLWEAQYPGAFTRWLPSLSKARLRVGSGTSVVLWQWTSTYAAGGRSFDASRPLVSLNSLRIPPRRA